MEDVWQVYELLLPINYVEIFNNIYTFNLRNYTRYKFSSRHVAKNSDSRYLCHQTDGRRKLSFHYSSSEIFNGNKTKEDL